MTGRGFVCALWTAFVPAWFCAGAQFLDVSDSNAGRPAAACSAAPPGSSGPAAYLLACSPGIVTEPLDLSGLYFARRPMVSTLGFTWTGSRFRAWEIDLAGANQPGQPWALFSPSTAEVRAVQGLDRAIQAAPAVEVRFLPPEAGPAWRARLNLAGTAASLASSNLPPPASRGLLRQPERFRWFSGNDLQVSGPIARRTFAVGTASGHWGSQTVPQATPGRDLESSVLSLAVRLSADLTDYDRIRVSGLWARYRLSEFGLPPGLAGLLARRMSPEYFLPTWGFAGLRQSDGFSAVGGAWRRSSAGWSTDIGCSYSRASTDSNPVDASGTLAQLDLAGGIVGDVPPLAGNASRSRTECLVSADLPPALSTSSRHRVKLGGGWARASLRERPIVPGGRHLIFAESVPAFVVQFEASSPGARRLSSLSAWLQDSIRLAPRLQLELAIHADAQRAGLIRAPRSRIAWNVFSSRVAAAFRPVSRLTVRGGYAAFQIPVAGRYLDYADPGSLSGIQFFWRDTDGDRRWRPAETGPTVFRFGGLYSSIDPNLRAPLVRETNIAVQASLFRDLQGSLQLYRQDLTRRIAAVNAGLGQEAFSPVPVADPGPDGLAGTYDDQILTLFAQVPSTFGNDRYLLTNARQLDMAAQGLLAEMKRERPGFSWWVSFLAMKALGPTNPGNSAFENDPGVVGALLMDPNTSVHAAGRTFFDRAYVGKAAFAWDLPARWSRISVASNAVYLDGLAFGRRLLVRGLPQGPFLAAATVRGSPEGGHRTQYVFHWNVRLSRMIPRPRYGLRPSVDVLNVLNRGHKLREMDLTSPRFLERLPVAIQPPRSFRLNMEITF